MDWQLWIGYFDIVNLNRMESNGKASPHKSASSNRRGKIRKRENTKYRGSSVDAPSDGDKYDGMMPECDDATEQQVAVTNGACDSASDVMHEDNQSIF